MIARIAASAALALLFTAPVRLDAHHSAVMFDEQKEITVSGTVKEFQYTNPHSWLLVDVTNKDGTVTTWGFEAEGPTTLLRNGVRPGDLKFGTKLTVTGHPMKDGRPGALWMKAVRDDGKEFYPAGRPRDAQERQRPAPSRPSVAPPIRHIQSQARHVLTIVSRKPALRQEG